jgi:hypothetical protein
MELDKDIKLDCFQASGIVTNSPCWLFSIVGSSSSATSVILTVRDGILEASLAKMILYCSLSCNPAIVFNQPVYFKNGLYLQFATGVNAANVQYKEEK